MSVDGVGWRHRWDDPPGVQRWWDGAHWTNRITGGAALAALTAAKSAVDGQAFPDVADVRELEVLRQRVRELESAGVVATGEPVIAGMSTPSVPTPPVAVRAPGPRSTSEKIGTGLDVVGRGAAMVSRVLVSLLWGAGVVGCFAIGQPLLALAGIAYLAYLWVWRGRWLIY
ncbi:hypothetical protein [Cellulomonas sp. KRMCY2]|uniref:hypothetical protein n=1 Tax=Cellulomonas sp. KRMCY2 TaxID=1304865 RepID=UPI00045E7A30|nr:hypothetical protein [Cellulomonas sp. KRMCY2]